MALVRSDQWGDNGRWDVFIEGVTRPAASYGRRRMLHPVSGEEEGMRRYTLLMVVALALVATACFGSAHATGGGWIDVGEGEKATFGFNFQCEKTFEGASAKGQLTYHDPSVGLKLKGVIEDCDFWKTGVTAEGTWRQQGKSDDFTSGEFTLTGTDGGPGGADTIEITVSNGGAYGLYDESGELQGGNIQDHSGD